MFRPAILYIKRMIFYVIFFCTISVSMLIGLMSYKPFIIDTNKAVVEHFLNIQGNQLKLRQLSMWFDGDLHLKGTDVEIYTQKNEPLLTINKLKVEFSIASLLLGRLTPKHIELEGLSVDVNINSDSFLIAGFPLKLNASDSQVDLINYLNEKGKISYYYSALKTLKAHNINLNIIDGFYNKSWFIKNGDVSFVRGFRMGETLDIKGKLVRPTLLSQTPVHIRFEHLKFADNAKINLKLTNVSSQFFDDYAPFDNPINTRGDIDVSLNLLPHNKIENTRMTMAMKKGSIHATSAYTNPFLFKKGFADISYANHDNGLLTIHQFSILDEESWPLELSGTIQHILTPKNLKFNLSLISKGDTTVKHVAHYLPDKKIKGTTDWINKHILSSKVSNLKLIYNGKPKALPFCDKKCGFDGTFDFENMSLTAFKHTSPFTDLSGAFVMKDDYIKITAKTAKIDHQKIKNVEAVIAGHFTKGIETGISINGDVSGSIQGLIDIIEQEIQSKNKSAIKVKGTHKTTGSLYIPFKGLSYSKVRYNYKSLVENVRSTSLVEGYDARIPKADLSVTQEGIKLEADGTLNGYDVHYDWRENMQKPFQETLLSIDSELPALLVMNIISATAVDISNTVSVTLSVKAVNKGVYDYTFLSDMTKNIVSQNKLHWQKKEGQSLTVVGKGVYKNKEKSLPLHLSVFGKDENIQGTMQLGQKLEINFPKFILGSNDFKATLKKGVLHLKGKQLDLTNFNIFKSKNQGEERANLKIITDLKKVVFKDGVLEKVKTHIERQNGQWHHVDVTGEMNGKKVSFFAQYPSPNHLSLRLNLHQAGETFKTVGLIDVLRKGRGKLIANIDIVDGKKQGKGILKIDDVYLVNAPIMAQLLSLISLTELLSQKEGIYFKKVEIPLLFVGDEIIFNHAFLSGPSIGIRLKGKVNTRTEALNIEGQLIPAEGLNSLISKIPFIGTILTGSQAGLLVADFKIKGKISKPEVSANPISFVMPGLLKDFFGTLFNSEDVTKPTPVDIKNEFEFEFE